MNAKFAEKEKKKIMYIVKCVMLVLPKILFMNVKKMYLIKIVQFVWKISSIQEIL